MKKVLFIIICLIINILNVNALETGFNLYEKMESEAVLDDTSSEFVTSDTGIDFSHTSSSTNGKGLYILSSTKDEENKIIYYRGNIDNNFVLLANHCFQILRTTTDGKIKLLYAGKATDNKCLAEDQEMWALDSKVKYNVDNSVDSLGYMIPDADGNINSNDSIVKASVDEWFSTNFSEYLDEFADTIFCNDRTYNSSLLHFYGWQRLQEGKPSLVCDDINDAFSVGNIGNGKLTYPVALITTDELMLAGAQYSGVDQNNYYDSWALIHAAYWAMTPNSSNKILYPNSQGYINRNSMTSSSGVRPVVAILNDTILLNGIGTRDNPYQVPKQVKYTITTDDYSNIELEEAIENQMIKINIGKREGYTFKGIKIIDTDTNEVIEASIIEENNSKYLKMPNHNIKIETIWEEIPVIVDEVSNNIDNPINKTDTVDKTDSIDNPDTGDTIIPYIILMVLSIISIIILQIGKVIEYKNM